MELVHLVGEDVLARDALVVLTGLPARQTQQPACCRLHLTGDGRMMSTESISSPALTGLCAEAVHRLSSLRGLLPRLPATITYSSAVAAVAVVLARLDPQTRDRVMQASSTNLHNLRSGKWPALFTSAFVVEHPSSATWWLALAGLMSTIELSWGTWNAIGVLAAGHVGATLLVAGGLAVGVARGWIDPRVEDTIDVGISYGAMAFVGAVVAELPGPARPAWVAGWTLTGAASVVLARDFTSVGHLCALLIGAGIAGVELYRASRRRRLAVVPPARKDARRDADR